jgi:hypothetical protein
VKCPILKKTNENAGVILEKLHKSTYYTNISYKHRETEDNYEDDIDIDCVIYSIATGLPAILNLYYRSRCNESRGQDLKYKFKWFGSDGKPRTVKSHEEFKNLAVYLIGKEEQVQYEDMAFFLTSVMVPSSLEDDCFNENLFCDYAH